MGNRAERGKVQEFPLCSVYIVVLAVATEVSLSWFQSWFRGTEVAMGQLTVCLRCLSHPSGPMPCMWCCYSFSFFFWKLLSCDPVAWSSLPLYSQDALFSPCRHRQHSSPSLPTIHSPWGVDQPHRVDGELLCASLASILFSGVKKDDAFSPLSLRGLARERQDEMLPSKM